METSPSIETVMLGSTPDYVAPDGSEIRLLPTMKGYVLFSKYRAGLLNCPPAVSPVAWRNTS